MGYRVEVLDALLTHGVRPDPATSPALVRKFVSDLYRYELKTLRARLLRGDLARADYPMEILKIKARYPLLAYPLRLWTAEA